MTITGPDYEKAKGNYFALMQIIDECKNDEAPPSKGLLYFLKGVVPELAVTKYGKRSGLKDIKEFFCNEVLKLNDGNNRSFCEYENYFRNGNADGYLFTPEFMNECIEDNNLSESGNPKLLLRRLWQVAHECLNSYFRKESKEEPEEEKEKEHSNWEKKERWKSDNYCRFVKAVGLYEIFVMKFLGDASLDRALEKMEELECCLDEVQLVLSDFCVPERNISEKEAEGVLDKLEGMVYGETKVLHDEVVKETGRVLDYFWHIKYLATFSMIIMLVEFNNVITYSPSKKLKRNRVLTTMNLGLEEEQKFLYMSNVKMNKSGVYTVLYKDLVESAEQNRIFQELCSTSSKIQNRALEQIKEYFYKVQEGDYQDKNGNEEEDFAKVVMQIAVKCMEMKKN